LVYLKQRQLVQQSEFMIGMLAQLGDRRKLQHFSLAGHTGDSFLEEAIEELKAAIALDPNFSPSSFTISSHVPAKGRSFKA